MAAPGLCTMIGEVLENRSVTYSVRENHQCYEGLIATGVCELSRDEYRRCFVELDELQRESVLRIIEQSEAGRNWLSLLLTYLLEALLADPVYGGNPDGLGWKWLEHQPGYPTPPQDKSWYKLTAPVRYQRKA